MKDEDKRTQRRTVSLSLREATLIDQARGDAPMARWLREAAIERLSRDLGIEDVDTARRPTPRRRNYAEREVQARLHDLTALYWETLQPAAGQLGNLTDISWEHRRPSPAARHASWAKFGDSAITQHFTSSAVTSDSAATVPSAAMSTGSSRTPTGQ